MEEDVKWNVHFNKTGKLNRRICTSTFRLTEMTLLSTFITSVSCFANKIILYYQHSDRQTYVVHVSYTNTCVQTFICRQSRAHHVYKTGELESQRNHFFYVIVFQCQAQSQFSPWFKVPSIHLFILLFVHSWWGQNILWIFFSRNQFLPLLTSGSKSQCLRQILITEDWKYFCITVSQEVGQI